MTERDPTGNDPAGNVTETDSTGMCLERTFAASAEEVFDAWTDPEVLRRWWAAGPDWRTPVAEVDLRVGGRYRLSMEDPATGAQHTVGGEYREVRRPQRLVYSWSWEQDGQEPAHVSTVTVEFRSEGELTTVLLEHTGLPSSDSSDRHSHGWAACLENLRTRVFTSVPHAS
jgi:uncharacterized protein YndB with AHSA1/START domain